MSLTLVENTSQALEPVCNFSEVAFHQSFHKLFRTGFSNPALTNALMLALAFTENGYQVSEECLRYQSNAIHHLKEKIEGSSSLDVSSLIGTILLLIGVEVSVQKYWYSIAKLEFSGGSAANFE
jgi:hypothetical protein